MNKYLNYVLEFQENNKKGVDFVNNQLKKHLVENIENQTEIETILDYLYSNQSVDVSKIGYKTILGKTEKRHKKLQSVSTKNDETEGVDYEVFLDYSDGFKFVTLKSKESYEREGKLMSHCVSSYYGRDTVIYSLRDENNKPHCTIEDGRQIKGKGNGKIDPKYIDYVVQFLNKKGMSVGENEMKNLGYYKLDTIEQGLECEHAYNGYVYENKLDTIQKDGEQYLGFGLLKIKKLVEVKADFSLKFNFDIYAMICRFNKKIRNVVQTTNRHSSTAVANDSYSTAVANASYSTAVANASSSTAVANDSSSTAVANDSYSTAVANASSSTAVANDSSSTAVANDSYSTAVANASSSTAVANASYSTAVANDSYSTAVANDSSSTAVANDSYSTAVANRHSSTAVANRHSSTAVAKGKNSIALTRSYKSKVSGKIGARLVITERDKKEENIIEIKTCKVDGKVIKEDTFYHVIDGVIVEWKE